MESKLKVALLALVGLLLAVGIGVAAYAASRDSVGLPVTKLDPKPLAPTVSPAGTTTRADTTTHAGTTTTSATTTDDHGGRTETSGSRSGRGGGGDDD